MSGAKPKVKPVKPIAGVLFQRRVNLDSINSRLISLLGPIDHKSTVFDFIFTDYYLSEMGGDLKKCFYSFEKLIMPDALPDIKNAAIRIESELASENKRTVNIDPGYLEESKLVLASTKNFSHRIYLRDHIWGEVTLRYVRGEFVKHDWTYPDYSQDLAIEFLAHARDIYKRQLNGLGI